MKLIFCPHCHDIRKLGYDCRYCSCGESWGYYQNDGINAVVGGKAIPLGIENSSLKRAIQGRPDQGIGSRIEAFVIPVECPTVRQD
ncbi:MAG: hypothetical protein AAF959_29430 [Cyanobacteria bacterium P01_D01_bin.56]